MYRVVFFLNLALLVSSCGDGDSANNKDNSIESNWPPASVNESPNAFGYFVDSQVMGLRFKSGGHYGVTDVDGRFGYIKGQKIQFFVGDTPLGEEVEPSSRLTPYELAGLDARVAMNITQFLQTIDNDALPDNGITINESVHILAEGIKLDYSSSGWIHDPLSLNLSTEKKIVFELTSATEAGSRYLVPRYTAYLHLSDTLDAIIDELEITIKDIVSQSSCVTADQCLIVEFRRKYSGGYCPQPAEKIVYSELDADLISFENAVNERSYLIDAREAMEDAATNENYTTTGFCIILEKEAFPVCNHQQRCEIQYY